MKKCYSLMMNLIFLRLWLRACRSGVWMSRPRQSGHFDVIVMDLMMPEMAGLEALKALKVLKPESQIILLTGYATREIEAEALKLGAVDLIEKPADIERLLEKIKEAQSKKSEQ